MSRLKAKKMPPYMTVVYDPKRRRQLDAVLRKIEGLPPLEPETNEDQSTGSFDSENPFAVYPSLEVQHAV